jgi:NitT/TauT family transport system permease protein
LDATSQNARAELEATDGGASAQSSTSRVRSKSWLWVLLGRVAVVTLFIGAWQIVYEMELVRPLFLPPPIDVWEGLVMLVESGQLRTDGWATTQAALIALAIGVPAGIVAGFALSASRYIDSIVSPFLVPMNTVPRIALAPLFITWFGLGMTSKVVLAVSLVFFLMLFSARAAVKSVDPDLRVVAQLTGLTRRATFRKIVLPSAVPSLAAAARVCVTYSFLGVIAGEMQAGDKGMGQIIVFNSNVLNVNVVFAALIALSLIATFCSFILGRLEDRLLVWQ